MSDERPWALACHHLGRSLSLVSCRSRAEAFARRLRTQLESTLSGKNVVGGTNRESATMNGLHLPRDGASEKMRLLSATTSSSNTDAITTTAPTSASFQLHHHHHAPQLAHPGFDDDELFYDFDLASPLDQVTPRPFASEQDAAVSPFIMGPACTHQPLPNYNNNHHHPYVGKWSTSTTSPAWSPTDDARESAYCSGGELDGRALEQGHGERGSVYFSNNSTTLALADTSEDEDEEDMFSECRESAENEEEDEMESWKEAVADRDAPPEAAEELLIRTTTPGESAANVSRLNQTTHFDVTNFNGEVKKTRAMASNELDIDFEMDRVCESGIETETNVIENLENVKTLLSVVANEIDDAIANVSAITSENVDKSVQIVGDSKAEANQCVTNVYRTENGNVCSTKLDEMGKISVDIPNVKDCTSSEIQSVDACATTNNSMHSLFGQLLSNEFIIAADTEPTPVDTSDVFDTNVIGFLTMPEDEKEMEAMDDKNEEEVEEVEEEEEDEDEILHSPTWGMLKQIDRFQVRQLVKECEEGPSNGEDINELKENNENATETLKEKTVQLSDSSVKEQAYQPIHKQVPCTEDPVPPPSTSNVEPLCKIQVHTELPQDPTQERTRKISRSSSLKTGRTPPGTPGLKKIVRFADVLGLDLEDVRHVFLEDLPTVPLSAYEDLESPDVPREPPSQEPCSASTTDPVDIIPPVAERTPAKTLVAMFAQPLDLPNLVERVQRHKVCLENAFFADSAIRGHVRVLNVAFHKTVHIRYTLNEWKSFFDLEAIYLPESTQDRETDRFAFCIFGGDTLDVGERLVFCVRYSANHEEYWDNNNGSNYFFQCIQESSPLPPSPVDNWIHFL